MVACKDFKGGSHLDFSVFQMLALLSCKKRNYSYLNLRCWNLECLCYGKLLGSCGPRHNREPCISNVPAFSETWPAAVGVARAGTLSPSTVLPSVLSRAPEGHPDSAVTRILAQC